MTRKSIRVRERKILGLAWHEDRLIEIDPSLKGLERLDTLIHEALHITMPDLDEGTVNAKATEIAGVVWKDGYRRRA